MSIEKLIEENTAAIKELTATLIATTKLAPSTGAATGESGETKASTTKAGAKTEAKAGAKKEVITQEQMKAALTELKDASSPEECTKIIKAEGKVEKMKDVKEPEYAAVYKAAKARLAEIQAGGDEPEEEEM